MHRIVTLTFFVILGLIVGCSSTGSKVAKTDSPVLDVAPSVTPSPIPAAEPSLAAGPINDSPQVAFAPTPEPAAASMTTASPAKASVAAPAAGKSYTVKKGDTLFSIAKTQLGSGRDWQKIAAANPGLTPQKLKAGQQIAMP